MPIHLRPPLSSHKIMHIELRTVKFTWRLAVTWTVFLLDMAISISSPLSSWSASVTCYGWQHLSVANKKKEELNQDVGQVLWLVGRWFNETVELMTADGEGGSRRCKTRFLSSVEVAFIDGRVPLRVCQMGFLVGIPGMPRSWWSKTNEKWELLGWNF